MSTVVTGRGRRGLGHGGLKAGDGEMLQAYVNGKSYQGDPTSIILHTHDEIAIVYGTPAEQANPPSSYAFPAGL